MTGGSRTLALLAGIVAMNVQWLVFQGQVTTLHSAWGWTPTPKCSLPASSGAQAGPYCTESGVGTPTVDAGQTCTPACATDQTVSDATAISCPATAASPTSPDNGWWSTCPPGATCSSNMAIGASVTCASSSATSAATTTTGSTTGTSDDAK